MIRYNKTIHIKTTPNGAYTITGDRMAVSYKTSAINGYEYIRTWWERQHHSTLREYQKDLLIRHIPQAFQAIDWQWRLTPYVVYADGAGYNQPHDIAFATLDNPDFEKRIYLLGTGEHTWIHYESKHTEKFALHSADAYASVGVEQGRQEIWEMYDNLRKIEETNYERI